MRLETSRPQQGAHNNKMKSFGILCFLLARVNLLWNWQWFKISGIFDDLHCEASNQNNEEDPRPPLNRNCFSRCLSPLAFSAAILNILEFVSRGLDISSSCLPTRV